MKALTLWQPWASLVALGHKRVETRIWSTPHRGPLAIHSAKTIPPMWLGVSRTDPKFKKYLDKTIGADLPALPLGTLLCVCNLVECAQADDIADDLSEQEIVFGNYSEGRYAWFLADVTPINPIIKCKGNRRLWNLQPEVLQSPAVCNALRVMERRKSDNGDGGNFLFG